MPPAAPPPATTTPPVISAVGLVLVAEDDQSLRELIVLALHKRKVNSVGVEDGQQACAAIQQGWEESHPVALLITDIQMPRYSGLELLAFVEAAPTPIPVIVISSFMSTELRRDAEQMGARAVFSKPFDLRLLLDAVERNLGG